MAILAYLHHSGSEPFYCSSRLKVVVCDVLEEFFVFLCSLFLSLCSVVHYAL